MPQNTCRKCGADIRMAKSAFNPEKNRILDAAPNPEGNTFVITWGRARDARS